MKGPERGERIGFYMPLMEVYVARLSELRMVLKTE